MLTTVVIPPPPIPMPSQHSMPLKISEIWGYQPAKALAATSSPKLLARPQNKQPKPKTLYANKRQGLRPKISLSLPYSGWKLVRVRKYLKMSATYNPQTGNTTQSQSKTYYSTHLDLFQFAHNC